MEAFSLLKYWRGGGGAVALSAPATARPAVSITTIAASALPSAEVSEEESANGDDEGPFIDLEFAVPDEECQGDGNEDDDAGSSREGEEMEEVTDDEGAAEEREFNFTVSSEGSCGDLRADPSLLPLSPSDDLFFKGRLVPLESSSLVFNHGEAHARPHILPVSLLKTKFRVLMLGFRRPKHVTAATPAGESLNGSAPAAAAPSPRHPQQRPSKLFTVKFKVEEVPIVSLFTRDNSSRSTGSNNGRSSKQQGDECGAPAAAPGEKKLSKELVQKYINKIKPLYVRVSKRYAEKLKFSGQLATEGAVTKETTAQAPTPPSTALAADETEAKSAETDSDLAAAAAPASVTVIAKGVQKPAPLGNLPSGLRVVCKHLGKSRSASAAVAAVPSPTPTLARRRDDSLLQQQDGIQSAIAHCKMSFNASKEGDSSLQPPSKSELCIDKTEPTTKEDCV